MPNYIVKVTSEFIIKADDDKNARHYARSIEQSLNEAGCQQIHGGGGSAVRSIAPRVSAPKLTNKQLPKYPATRRR